MKDYNLEAVKVGIEKLYQMERLTQEELELLDGFSADLAETLEVLGSHWGLAHFEALRIREEIIGIKRVRAERGALRGGGDD
jgi:hypothetical protein